MGLVVVVDGVEIVAFEAEVEEGWLGIFGVDGVELEELVVVDLDEGLVGDAVAAEVEGLVEAEFFVEVDGGAEVFDADGDVGDAGERRDLLGWRSDRGGEEERQSDEAGGSHGGETNYREGARRCRGGLSERREKQIPSG